MDEQQDRDLEALSYLLEVGLENNLMEKVLLKFSDNVIKGWTIPLAVDNALADYDIL